MPPVIDRGRMPRLALRALRILACMLSFTVAAGCGDSCRTLADQICLCLPDDGTRAACAQRAKDAEQSFSLRAEDQAFCQRKIDAHSCDCNQLQSAAGKEACGISFGSP